MNPLPNPTHPRPLAIAVIGAGRMAHHHVRAVERTGRARVVAVGDPEASAREAFAAAFPSLPVFSGLEAIVEGTSVDAVHVVTPPHTHGLLARQALGHGLHVYVEKPFAESVVETEELLRVAAERHLQVCAGHQLLFERPTRLIEDLLPSLGRLVHVESYFSFRPVRHVAGGRAPLRPDLQLLDILSHPVYLLLRILERSGPDPVELASLTVSPDGTVHALIRSGPITGTLIVTLEGRPVESYLRVVGRNGTLCGDYVRGTVQRAIGPGTSGLDKLIAPYRQAWQQLGGTTVALGRRLLKRQRSYPGLVELFSAFYDSIHGGPTPLTPESIRNTVGICERVAGVLAGRRVEATGMLPPPAMGGRGVLVTGGTGFLGRALVRSLVRAGRPVRVVARREPPSWNRTEGVDYRSADLADGLEPAVFEGIEVVVHCAAETAGGWVEHQRNSVEATERIVRGAAQAGVHRVVHVSSLAVLAGGGRGPLSDGSPLERNSRGSGPYVWGKLESERLALELARELGIEVKVVRPGALVDYTDFEPPGRLGKRVGNLFVAVGSPRHRLGTTDVGFAADYLAWMVEGWDLAPAVLNLLDPEPPTKRDLLRRLRAVNPDLTVVWLPTVLLVPLSWMALVAQKLIRPRNPAINVAKVFAVREYDTRTVRALAPLVGAPRDRSSVSTSGLGGTP